VSPLLIFSPGETKGLAPGSRARYAVPTIGLFITDLAVSITFSEESLLSIIISPFKVFFKSSKVSINFLIILLSISIF